MSDDYGFFWGPDYLSLAMPPQEWLLQDLLVVGGLINVFGPPKIAGKTYLSLQWAEAIANPEVEDWEGFPVRTHGPVVFVQLDTPRSIFQPRMKQLRDGLGMDFSNVAVMDLETTRGPVNVLAPGVTERFKRTVERITPVLVVIDVLREVFRGDENSSDVMTSVLQQLRSIAAPAACLIVSHGKKDLSSMKDASDDEIVIHAGRGSGASPGKMDMLIHLTDRTLTYKGRTEASGRLAVERDQWGCVRVVHEGLKAHDLYLRSLLLHAPERSAREWARQLKIDPKVGSFSESTLRQHLAKLMAKAR